MISRLRGILIAKQAPMIMIEVGGVGYEVQIPINSFYSLPQIGEPITLHTHFVVREDAQNLYGFPEEKQRTLFRALIKLNGIGPKSALAILSGMEPNVFIHNIINNNVNELSKLPGIGKKTAQRLVMEMRDNLEMLEYDLSKEKLSAPNANHDAISALISLGYKPFDANRVISQHKDKNLSSEELIRMALKELAGN